ncbi:hypothetical protein C9374_006837 [Naegleria lovaniensis]|uniref:Serine/threonine-protein kinase PLK n=1 Tax=Naegleria lovaniensis TaxID=51637 RepID=A0AA88KRH7_NAELO|nr:uncharacterized protein C9374_006837 [Naegleria lovaniensis]KAG2393306.1 hypothetical protein C9374_006837 [Naegleria lovaniensis]
MNNLRNPRGFGNVLPLSRPVSTVSTAPKRITTTAATGVISSHPTMTITSGKSKTPLSNMIVEYADKGGMKSIVSSYKQGELLGEGGFAKCYEVTDCSTGVSLAAKIIPKATLMKEKNKDKLLSEIKIHKKMSHKYVVGFEKFFEDNNNAYILLEMCHCKSLLEMMDRKKRLYEPEAQYIFFQILMAVKYMHTCRVIHRDLKLGNIFLDKYMRVKIGDFGLATEVHNNERKSTICGTPNYIAPEILQNKGHSYEVDIWSCGVILYTLLIGTPPFETEDVKTTYRRIQEGKYSFPPNVTISDNAKKFIKKMLNNDPKARPTIDEALADDFFKTMKSTACPTSLMKYAETHCRVDVKKNLEALQKEREELLKKKQEEAKKAMAAVTTPQPPVVREPLKAIDPNTLNSARKDPGVLDKLFKKVLPTRRRQDENQENIRPQSTKLSPTQPSARKDLKELSPSVSPKLRSVRSSSTRSPVPRTKVLFSLDFPDYGLCYRLSNGATGAFFNDYSKMVLSHDKTRLDYYAYNRDDIQSSDEHFVYSLTSYPDEIKKKVTLIKYFKGSLDSAMKQENRPELFELTGEDQSVYVKRYHKSSIASSYRLSNTVIQVKFNDKAEIMLSNNSHIVVYTNKKGQKEYVHEDSVSSPEFQTYIAHTKDLLKEMMNDS